MKVIIAGSRDITDLDTVKVAVSRSGFRISEVVSGCARGVDTLGEVIADDLGVPIKRFPALWNEYGKRAGYMRNVEMADYADGLVAIWDGVSKGTLHMINVSKKNDLNVYVYRVDIAQFEV